MTRIKLQEGDIVRLRDNHRVVGKLERVPKADRYDGGPWYVVAEYGTAQPDGGLRDVEFVSRPNA